jgi:hypothetical protein
VRSVQDHQVAWQSEEGGKPRRRLDLSVQVVRRAPERNRTMVPRLPANAPSCITRRGGVICLLPSPVTASTNVPRAYHLFPRPRAVTALVHRSFLRSASCGAQRVDPPSCTSTQALSTRGGPSPPGATSPTFALNRFLRGARHTRLMLHESAINQSASRVALPIPSRGSFRVKVSPRRRWCPREGTSLPETLVLYSSSAIAPLVRSLVSLSRYATNMVITLTREVPSAMEHNEPPLVRQISPRKA